VAESTGLRERKKAATRLALHHAALRLGAEFGVDRVSVEAIADTAKVSRRTFSNYFSSKEEAFFYGDAMRLRRLVEVTRHQPVDERPWTALSHAMEAVLVEAQRDADPAWLALRRQLRCHPGLIAHQVAAFTAIERELSTEVAKRLDEPDVILRSRALVAAFLAVVRVAIQLWMDHPDGTLVDTVRIALRDTAPAGD
jgi:AcrR family transcriptional regulator